MEKIKINCVYVPKQRIKNAMLYDDCRVLSTFLWWVKTEDTMLGVTRWHTIKEFLEDYDYSWYVPSHQELG